MSNQSPKPAAKQLTRWLTMKIKEDPVQPRKVFDERLIDELARNMSIFGQLMPIIGYVDPLDPMTFLLQDGARRVRAARRMVEPPEFMDAVVLPGPTTPVGLLLEQLCLGRFRENLSLPEQAEAFSRIMIELKLTQQQLAERLGVSPTKVSNCFSYRRLRADLQPAAAALEASVIPLIARVPTDAQPEVMNYAGTIDDFGKRPSRDDVQNFIAARRKTKPPRAKTFAGELTGHSFRVQLRPDETHDSLTEFLKSAIAFVQRHKDVPVANLSLILGG